MIPHVLSPLRRSLLALLLAAPLACGPSTEAGDDAGAAASGSPDAAATFAPTYFAVRADTRLCPSPTCGGFWVSAVNKPSTVCADGTVQRECYAATLDLSALRLAPAQEAQVRAAIGVSAASPAVLFQGKLVVPLSATSTLGVLAAAEAWLAPVPATVSGSFYGLGPSGIVCITTPCPIIRETLLNVGRVQNLSQVDLSRAPGTDKDKAAAQAAIMTGEGLLAAGTNASVYDRTWTTVLRATQYYRKVLPAAAGPLCGSAVCSAGQYCCNPVMSLCAPVGYGCIQ